MKLSKYIFNRMGDLYHTLFYSALKKNVSMYDKKTKN